MKARTWQVLRASGLLLCLSGCPSPSPADGGPGDGGPPVDAGSDAGFDAGPVDGGTCQIAGVFYGHSANNPGDPAQCCNPSTSATGWTERLHLVATLPFIPFSAPGALTAADLNGDGWTDLLATDNQGDALAVFVQRAGQFQQIVTYPTDREPRGIAIGDLDRDGKLDAVVVNATALTLGVFMGHGDGTFADQVSYPMGGPAAFVVTADFDGDGVLDVAAAVGQTIALFHGIGDGGLAAGVPFSVTGEPFGLLTADVRGNGVSDLAASVGYGLTLFLGHGDGGFAISASADAGSRSFGAATGDWNRNGRIDIALSVEDQTGVGLLLGNGDGTFAPPIPLNLGSATYPTIVDLNADGIPDLVFNCGGPLCVLWQYPDGGVSEPIVLTADAGSSLYEAVVADFNDDRSPDIATLQISGQSNVLVYRNQCP